MPMRCHDPPKYLAGRRPGGFQGPGRTTALSSLVASVFYIDLGAGQRALKEQLVRFKVGGALAQCVCVVVRL